MTCRVSWAEEAKMQEQVAPGSQDLPSYGVGAKAETSESSGTATDPASDAQPPVQNSEERLL